MNDHRPLTTDRRGHFSGSWSVVGGRESARRRKIHEGSLGQVPYLAACIPRRPGRRGPDRRCGLVHEQAGRASVLGVVQVPEGQSLSAGALAAQRLRGELEALVAHTGGERIEVLPRVRVVHHPWAEVIEAAQELEADLLLLPWGTRAEFLGVPLVQALQAAPCDVALVKGVDLERCRHILLPIRGGPYVELALRVALALAARREGEITVLHGIEGEPPWMGEDLYRVFLPLLHDLEQVTRVVTARTNVVEAILREARGHDVVVMGASALPSATEPIGRVATRVLDEAPGPVIVVRTRAGLELPPARAVAGELAPIDRTISVVVDKWFAENTFHSREFANLARLVELKERQGVTISLGLPALNEEATVGRVIAAVKGALMDRYPLLDEIVLIDSNSTDRTREIAAERGVPVYIHPEILPQYGSYRGKGEALWKSLYVLSGDIVAWIDTDITNIHPRFVYGILGPLLKEARIQFVKGFYRRPLKVGEKIQAGGGGRVTELVARPLLNLFYPELSGLIQPLSGEYAGRRTVLEQLPFFTGYGVETGLLIDLLEHVGLQAIAQVDLQERIHHNQPLPALSRMSFAIIQVIIQRLEERQRLRLLEEVNQSMKLIRYEPRHYFLEVEEIRDRERPPMITIPEYRARRGLSVERAAAPPLLVGAQA